MRIYLQRYRVDASWLQPLRAERNDSCSRIVMLRILLLAKRIHDRLVTSRRRLIITRRELLKEERHDLICSPPFGDKDVVYVMLRELLADLHEVLDEFNAKPCTASILRQDDG